MERNLLKQIHIPQPCHEDWDKMTVNERGRFCQSCQKTVHDFTGPLTEEMKELLNRQNTCGRFYEDEINQNLRFLVSAKRLGMLSQVRKTVSSAFLYLIFKIGTISELSAQISTENVVDVAINQKSDKDKEEQRRVSGIIKDNNGIGISNHSFFICDSAGIILESGLTDFNGNFSINIYSYNKEIILKCQRKETIYYRRKIIFEKIEKTLNQDENNVIIIERKSRLTIKGLFRRKMIVGKYYTPRRK